MMYLLHFYFRKRLTPLSRVLVGNGNAETTKSPANSSRPSTWLSGSISWARQSVRAMLDVSIHELVLASDDRVTRTGFPAALISSTGISGSTADRRRSGDASTTNDESLRGTANCRRSHSGGSRGDSCNCCSRGNTDVGNARHRRRDPKPGPAAPSRQVRQLWPTPIWSYACGDPSLVS